MKKLRCSKCGNVFDWEGQEEVIICPQCGTKLKVKKFAEQQSASKKEEDEQSELIEKKGNRAMWVATIIVIFVIVCAIVYPVICGTRDERLNENYKSESTMMEKKEEVPEVVELPDALFFMTELDPVKNSDGTYSFDGRFTKCSTSYYSSDITVYIQAVNGHSFSTSDPAFRNAIYIRNSGEYGTVAADLMYEPHLITNIYFRFTYDKDGNLVDFKQLY